MRHNLIDTKTTSSPIPTISSPDEIKNRGNNSKRDFLSDPTK